MSTAGPAWGDTARTQEALGAARGRRPRERRSAANDPKIFTDPQSLSFQRIDVSTGAQRKSMLLTLSDAGDGAGTWTVSVAPQAQTTGVRSTFRAPSTLAPGGDVAVPGRRPRRRQRATGENYGFVVLTRERRPAPRPVRVPRRAPRASRRARRRRCRSCRPATPRTARTASRRTAARRSRSARRPTYTGAPMNEDGAEHLYSVDINQPIVELRRLGARRRRPAR